MAETTITKILIINLFFQLKKIQRRILKQHSTILGTVEKKSEDIYLEYCTNGGGAENSENLKKKSFPCDSGRDPKFCGEQGNRE